MKYDSFHQFLLTHRPEITRTCDPDGDWLTDLAVQVREDPDAPLQDTALYAYLRKRLTHRFKWVADSAWERYLLERAA